MTDQKHRFLRGEADAWFARNRDKLRAYAQDSGRDQVVVALHHQALRPTSVLEIGASNGWRLHAIAQAFDAKTVGLEPSEEAVADGRKHYPDVELRLGSAESLPFDTNQFDLVIFGFCLYLIDPEDLFAIAAEADRVLADGGWLAIKDFVPTQPYRNPYSHTEGINSFKMDHARLFCGHPAYRLVYRQIEPSGQRLDPDDRIGVSLLHKDMKNAFPNNPYSSR